jgi:RNA polymerase sigma-70 factor (ECF subfamily)
MCGRGSCDSALCESRSFEPGLHDQHGCRRYRRMHGEFAMNTRWLGPQGVGTDIAVAATWGHRPGRHPVRLQLAERPDTLRAGGGAAYSQEAVFSRLRTGDQQSVTDLADEDLVRQCREGSQAAFTEIVRRYKDRVHWLIRRMVGGPDDEDLTQEVFIRAYQAMADLRTGATLRTWLFRIAHNLCATELKKRVRRGTHLSIEDEGEERMHRLLPESHGRLDEEFEKREFQVAVRALVERLPAQYREVLTLHYVNQVMYEEIADIMGIPLGTVKTHIHRAKLRLRDLMLAELDRSYLPGSGDQP